MVRARSSTKEEPNKDSSTSTRNADGKKRGRGEASQRGAVSTTKLSGNLSSETHYTLGIHCDAVRDVGSPGSKWERDCLSMIDDSREFG